jgi:hypothetical protein
MARPAAGVCCGAKDGTDVTSPTLFPTPRLHALLVAGALCCGVVLVAQAGGAGPASAGAGSDRRPQMAGSKTIDADELMPLFTASLGEWKQKVLERPIPSPEKMPLPAVRAEYVNGTQSAEITVTTSMPPTAAKGQRSVHRNRTERGENTVTMGLPNGLMIAARSRTADAAALEVLISSIDLARAEKLKPGKR